jgi:hypothetical protein
MNDLRELIKTWRARAKKYRDARMLVYASNLDDCADELERALAAAPQPAEVKQDLTTARPEYPECSGDPASCPENEGYGCCKPNPRPEAEGCGACGDGCNGGACRLASESPEADAGSGAGGVDVEALANKIGMCYGDGKVDLGAPIFAFTPKELAEFARRLASAQQAPAATAPDACVPCKCADCGSQNLGCYNSARQLMVCNDCGQIMETALARSLSQSQQAPAELTDEQAEQEFSEWLQREMPEGTVIGDPKWWAPRIVRAFAKVMAARGASGRKA